MRLLDSKDEYFLKDTSIPHLIEIFGEDRFSDRIPSRCIDRIELLSRDNVCTLYCNIVVYTDDGQIRLDVCKPTHGGQYSAFYSEEDYAQYPILKDIDEKILEELQRIGAKKLPERLCQKEKI